MNKINKILFLGIIGLLITISLPRVLLGNQSTILVQGKDELNLIPGKNNVIFQESFTVSYLINKNPKIRAISYFDYNENISIGYVNVFGGIGTDFAINNYTIYEISVQENLKLKT